MKLRHVFFESGVHLFVWLDDVALEAALPVLRHLDADTPYTLDRIITRFVTVPLVVHLASFTQEKRHFRVKERIERAAFAACLSSEVIDSKARTRFLLNSSIA
jgi:hypothetical protein